MFFTMYHSEYRKYKATLPPFTNTKPLCAWHPLRRLPAPGCPLAPPGTPPQRTAARPPGRLPAGHWTAVWPQARRGAPRERERLVQTPATRGERLVQTPAAARHRSEDQGGRPQGRRVRCGWTMRIELILVHMARCPRDHIRTSMRRPGNGQPYYYSPGLPEFPSERKWPDDERTISSPLDTVIVRRHDRAVSARS